ncbi:hypothetical protein DSM106972_074600 [Dulcicalothrix desertica PCC 7102]|uniref:HTH luxR-type domain-containing protein n=1 Tax=Dulcicalothrix desertica PCC 7102 TaxID=232991 RepID=A0A3S1AH30_9CYAN|nr:response regulator transcription factor [Dulcicalothrix desertica]RUT00332.1 hypothetical protein DSM106972_074600 [Dulcicalothrix desertica PCC 7102]
MLKSTPSSQLADAIRTLYQGHSQLGPTIAPKVFAQLNPSPSPAKLNSHQKLFSERELEILTLIGEGKNNREIAQKLFLTEGTVKNYVSQILARLELRDRTQAALWARENIGNG